MRLSHKSVSFVKSAVRIGAGVVLAWSGIEYRSPYFFWGGVLIVAAELLGIVEEIVEK